MADITFAHYYQTELAYFRELGQEFARAYPEVAYMVGGRGGDRAVERLIQGASLLTARLRFRVEDDLPEIAHAIFELMWPQYLRPMPAVTMIQFSGLADALRQSQPINKNTLLLSNPVESPSGGSVECTFRTCYDLVVHPIELTHVELDRAHPADLQLCLSFSLTGGASFDNMEAKTLDIQMIGDTVTQYTLYFWITHCANQITLRHPNGGRCMVLPKSKIRPARMSSHQALYPFIPTPLPGMRHLGELFTFPDKFLGVEILGLDNAPDGLLKESFELVFHLGQPPDSGTMHIDINNFALGCVPAINISKREEVDLTVEAGKHKYRLKAPFGGQVFDVEKVGGYNTATSQWINYRHFFAEGLSRLEGKRPCYRVVRRADGVEGVISHLMISDMEGKPMTPPTEQLHVAMSYTNGTTAHLLRENDVSIPSVDSPEFVSFTNITPVQQGEPVGLERDRHWQLLAQFAIHPNDLFSKDGLQQLLNEASADRPGVTTPEILSLECHVSNKLFKQTIVPVREVKITVNKEEFACEGQLCLFARILGSLLSRPSNSNVFHRVWVGTMDNHEEFIFET